MEVKIQHPGVKASVIWKQHQIRKMKTISNFTQKAKIN